MDTTELEFIVTLVPGNFITNIFIQAHGFQSLAQKYVHICCRLATLKHQKHTCKVCTTKSKF